MSVTDLNNTPIEFDIGGKCFKVKKLSVLDIFGQVETKIKQEYISTITEMSKVLPDKDRPEFLKNAIKEMPTGKRLEDAVNERVSTVSGGVDILYTILSKCQEITMDEIMAMVAKEENASSISSIMSFALGQGQKDDKKESVGETKPKK